MIIRLEIEKNVEKKTKKKWKNTKKKRKKNEKKTKKNEKNSRFFTFFGFFKNWLKIGHFGGLRLEPKNEKIMKKNEKKRKKLEFFYVFLIFQNLAKRRAGKHKKTKKKRKKNEKKTMFFTFFGFFKNLLKIGHFGGLRASLQGGGPETTKNGKKWKKLEVFYVFWIFQKLATNRPFWWPPRFYSFEHIHMWRDGVIYPGLRLKGHTLSLRNMTAAQDWQSH